MSATPDFLSSRIEDISAEIVTAAHARGVAATKLAALDLINKMQFSLDVDDPMFPSVCRALSDVRDAIFELEVPA